MLDFTTFAGCKMQSILAETRRKGLATAPSFWSWQIRCFLALFAVLAYGGTVAGARLVGISEAGGETSVIQEATGARRDVAASKRLRERRGSEIEECKAKRSSPRRNGRLRSIDKKSPVCECFGTTLPPRAPPALV